MIFQAAVMLLKNDEMIETIWAESIPYWSSSSNTAILELTSGDQVWLVLLSRAPFMHGYMYSTFSGFLLYKIEEAENRPEKTEAWVHNTIITWLYNMQIMYDWRAGWIAQRIATDAERMKCLVFRWYKIDSVTEGKRNERVGTSSHIFIFIVYY